MRKNTLTENKKFFIAIGVILILALLITLKVVTNIQAAKYQYVDTRDLPNNCYIQYANIEIQPGDTVYDIARAELSNEDHITSKYVTLRQQVSEIMKINNINGYGKITSGDYIIVPYIIEK